MRPGTGSAGVLLVLLALGAAAAADMRELQRATTLRSGPGAWFPMLQRLKRGEQVDCGERDGAWLEADTAVTNGWIPALALKAPRRGIDYGGLLGGTDVVAVSSVDIAAATKGAFVAAYSERHKLDMAPAAQLDAVSVAPSVVALLARSLKRDTSGRLLERLPRRPFDNNIVLSFDAEALLGHTLVAHQAACGLDANRSLSDYANAVAMIVGAHTERYALPYRVGILDDDSINGFGLPGGYVLLTRGYVSRLQNEAELACVIAHEMAHISLFHGLREFQKREIHRRRDSAFAELDSISGDSETQAIEDDLNRLADTAYMKIMGGRAREDELEADLYGMAYASAAGYDPMAMVDLLRRVGASAGTDPFRHHPSVADRASAMKKAVSRYRLQRKGRQRFKKRFYMMAGMEDEGEPGE